MSQLAEHGFRNGKDRLMIVGGDRCHGDRTGTKGWPEFVRPSQLCRCDEIGGYCTVVCLGRGGREGEGADDDAMITLRHWWPNPRKWQHLRPNYVFGAVDPVHEEADGPGKLWLEQRG